MLRPLAGLSAAVAGLAPAAALACGGFFCNSTPVDQSAERILFVQEDAETVSSYVEIMYQGEPEGFAWIVPVPEVPELDVWYGGAFNALDLATGPSFTGNFGCFEAAAGGVDSDADGVPEEDPAVDVLAREQVGPFDTVTIASADPRALVDWLRENGYRILPEMEPFVALYTAEGMKFVAMKLQPGQDVAAIQPIKMTYRAQGPGVPLRLTAVAAQLEMGVKVWVLADKRYDVVNMPGLAINDADLVYDDWTGQTNYVGLVARAVDAAGGHGFVTEYATPTAELAAQIRDSFVPEWAGQEAIDARDALADVLASKPYLTRLYTRVSPEEMDIDPVFAESEGGDVSRVHEIPERPGQDACGGVAEDFDACAFAACGAGGACAEVAGPGNRPQAGCACAEGTLARAVPDPSIPGGVAVACGDARMNFLNPDLAPAGPDPLRDFADACLGNPCGENGECISLNGFASCRCDAGFVAVGARDDAGLPRSHLRPGPGRGRRPGRAARARPALPRPPRRPPGGPHRARQRRARHGRPQRR
ncbi:MAG: DUF2330 domain-containing protein [bacterium]